VPPTAYADQPDKRAEYSKEDQEVLSVVRKMDPTGSLSPAN
jgi:hypothetical protein